MFKQDFYCSKIFYPFFTLLVSTSKSCQILLTPLQFCDSVTWVFFVVVVHSGRSDFVYASYSFNKNLCRLMILANPF